MEIWNSFKIFGSISIILWSIVICFSIIRHRKGISHLRETLIVSGIFILMVFITSLWIHLDRPPMKTLGETRLWYSFFISIVGYIVYKKWQYNWFLTYCLCLSILFLTINIFRPETYSKELMPALQSAWFVPHVIVYMVSYALLGASSLVAVRGLYEIYKRQFSKGALNIADNIVYIGFGFLTLGLIFGALWAKEAWGHYWTWDPKETWAFVTWVVYLIYIHFRLSRPKERTLHLIILASAFVVLLVCWFGINYLPIAQNSVHTYS